MISTQICGEFEEGPEQPQERRKRGVACGGRRQKCGGAGFASQRTNCDTELEDVHVFGIEERDEEFQAGHGGGGGRVREGVQGLGRRQNLRAVEGRRRNRRCRQEIQSR